MLAVVRRNVVDDAEIIGLMRQFNFEFALAF